MLFPFANQAKKTYACFLLKKLKSEFLHLESKAKDIFRATYYYSFDH